MRQECPAVPCAPTDCPNQHADLLVLTGQRAVRTRVGYMLYFFGTVNVSVLLVTFGGGVKV